MPTWLVRVKFKYNFKINIMRIFKILLVGMCIVSFSCEGGDDIITEALNNAAIDQDNKTYFTPPDWIIGTWYSETDSIGNWSGVKFTNIDVIEFGCTYAGHCVNNSNNKMLNKILWGEHQYTLLEETATDTSYFFSIRNNHPFYYDTYNKLFQKISNDSLIRSFSNNNSSYTTVYERRD